MCAPFGTLQTAQWWEARSFRKWKKSIIRSKFRLELQTFAAGWFPKDRDPVSFDSIFLLMRYKMAAP
jgi:hypothetical protein